LWKLTPFLSLISQFDVDPLCVVCELDQRLVQLLGARRPDGADAPEKGVEGVAAAAAGEADPQVATLLRRRRIAPR
jgi:hypothetical protein